MNIGSVVCRGSVSVLTLMTAVDQSALAADHQRNKLGALLCLLRSRRRRPFGDMQEITAPPTRKNKAPIPGRRRFGAGVRDWEGNGEKEVQFFNFRFCLHPPHNLPARHSPVNHRSGTDRETRTGRTSSRFWTPGTELKLLCTVSRLCRTCFAVIPMGRDKSNPRRVISARTPWSGAWRHGMHALSVVVLLSVDRGVVCFASRAAVRGIAVCHSLLVMVSPLALSFFFFFFWGFLSRDGKGSSRSWSPGPWSPI